MGDTVILKSGSDFREFSQINVTFGLSNWRPTVEVLRHEVCGDVPRDPQLQAVVEQYTALVEAGMQEEIGCVDCDLEGRFSYIRYSRALSPACRQTCSQLTPLPRPTLHHRTQETNLGNLVTDVMRKATRADLALLNSGTFRSDNIHEAGTFKMKVGHRS